MIFGFAIACIVFLNYSINVFAPSKSWAQQTLEAAGQNVHFGTIEPQATITETILMLDILVTKTELPTFDQPSITPTFVPTNVPTPSPTLTVVCDESCIREVQNSVMLSLTPQVIISPTAGG